MIKYRGQIILCHKSKKLQRIKVNVNKWQEFFSSLIKRNASDDIDWVDIINSDVKAYKVENCFKIIFVYVFAYAMDFDWTLEIIDSSKVYGQLNAINKLYNRF